MAKRQPKEKKGAALIPFILLALVAILGITLIYANYTRGVSEIDSFEDCANAGFPIMESFPEQCATPDGRTFTRQPSDTFPSRFNAQNTLCVNRCGDSTCAEVVCQGEGCPCAETPESCPQDCQE